MGRLKVFVPDVSATLGNVQKLMMTLTINRVFSWRAEHQQLVLILIFDISRIGEASAHHQFIEMGDAY